MGLNPKKAVFEVSGGTPMLVLSKAVRHRLTATLSEASPAWASRCIGAFRRLLQGSGRRRTDTGGRACFHQAAIKQICDAVGWPPPDSG
jgi:hypothetical protein